MKPTVVRPHSQYAFTLIELLCVIVIIAILAGLIMPVIQNSTTKAYDLKCMNNLRQIGVAANAAASDNDNAFPIIEFDPISGTVQQTIGDAIGVTAQTIDIALKPYGVTPEMLQCPADLKAPPPTSYSQYNSSYMWSPYSEDTNASVPSILRRRGNLGASIQNSSGAWIQIAPSRLQLASDYSAVHYSSDGNSGAGKMIYVLYGDGHVRTSRRQGLKQR